jgi:hypothetical protein
MNGRWRAILALGQTTRDHEIIRKRAKARGGRPATVRDTDSDGEAGILPLDLEPTDEGLEAISWEEFFRKFDEADLSFLCQEKTAAGKTSRFHKFVRE